MPRSDDNFLRQRLRSLDVYRGLIMVSLAFGGFGLAKTAENFLAKEPDNYNWILVQFNFTHVQWVGCGFWDLIQPSFMFMVGVSMAFSYAKRAELGHSSFRMFGHAVVRSIVLVLLGVFLSSQSRSLSITNWAFMNVLSQIGLGYTFLFCFWRKPLTTQLIGVLVILLGTYGIYASNPRAGIDLQTGKKLSPDSETNNSDVGITPEWAEKNLHDPDSEKLLAKIWHKNANAGHQLDVVLLNQFPRPEKKTESGTLEPQPFLFNAGGYQTLNFLPSLATMLIGLICGELLRSQYKPGERVMLLLFMAGIGIAMGYGIHVSGLCPIVKRIWTPSWTLYSAGWCCLMLATIYLVVDVCRLGFLGFFFTVAGTNSIAMYLMAQMLKPWTAQMLKKHLGSEVFSLEVGHGPEKLKLYSESYAEMIGLWSPTIQAVMVGLVFWLICFYLYRQRIFIRI